MPQSHRGEGVISPVASTSNQVIAETITEHDDVVTTGPEGVIDVDNIAVSSSSIPEAVIGAASEAFVNMQQGNDAAKARLSETERRNATLSPPYRTDAVLTSIGIPGDPSARHTH